MYTLRKRKYQLRPKKKKKLPLDLVPGYLGLITVVAYVCLFYFFQTNGFVLSSFSFGFLIILIPIWIVDGLKGFLDSFSKRSYLSAEEDLSKVTVVIACKDGEEVIAPTLKSLVSRIKPEQIIVASNGSTDDTCMIAKGFGVQVLDIKKPLGKVRAINSALNKVKTPYVLLLDDDTLVGDARIPTGLLDEGYDAVAFRVLVVQSNWVSKLQMYEYLKSTDLGKRHHNKRGSVQNISGAIGLFKIKQLKRQIKTHSGEFSGEDLQRTMLIHLAQDSKGVVLTDSTVYTNPPTTVHDLFKQRVYGWFPGSYANFRNYLKVMTRDEMPFALRYDAFHNVFFVMLMDILRVLSLPILIFYPWYFVITYVTYLILEVVAYKQTKLQVPPYILLIYPFYGLFNFITRVCAFFVFVYRRLNITLSSLEFLDDYRAVKSRIKIISTFLTITFSAVILWLNATYFYIKSILNIGA